MATHEPLIVVLEGTPIGRITRDDNWRLRLTFDEAYRSDPTATELSVSMPRASAASRSCLRVRNPSRSSRVNMGAPSCAGMTR